MKLLKIFFYFSLIVFISCSKIPSPERIPITMKENLRLLQKDPQFLIYLNFNNMRGTDFWKSFIGDSILKAESDFQSALKTFKDVTGTSISDGLNEFYLANSWDGENTIVIIGAFNKEKIINFIKNDTSYTTIYSSNNTPIYVNKNNNLYFYLRDNSTICASNYMKRLESIMVLTDTSKNTLIENPDFMHTIEKTMYKSQLMMITNQKTFIRGIFLNLFKPKLTSGLQELKKDSTGNYSVDSTVKKEENFFDKLHENINSFAFSSKMGSELKVIIQFEFDNDYNAETFSKVVNGIISISKAQSASQPDSKQLDAILNSIEILQDKNQCIINILITKDNIEEFRKIQLMNKPE
ncbi:MAG: hypothetical protein N2490_02395 [Ignavibacteria bacterium]|nr:hypothetical protein [Ignavibacteria bacterium]